MPIKPNHNAHILIFALLLFYVNLLRIFSELTYKASPNRASVHEIRPEPADSARQNGAKNALPHPHFREYTCISYFAYSYYLYMNVSHKSPYNTLVRSASTHHLKSTFHRIRGRLLRRQTKIPTDFLIRLEFLHI